MTEREKGQQRTPSKRLNQAKVEGAARSPVKTIPGAKPERDAVRGRFGPAEGQAGTGAREPRGLSELKMRFMKTMNRKSRAHRFAEGAARKALRERPCIAEANRVDIICL